MPKGSVYQSRPPNRNGQLYCDSNCVEAGLMVQEGLVFFESSGRECDECARNSEANARVWLPEPDSDDSEPLVPDKKKSSKIREKGRKVKEGIVRALSRTKKAYEKL